MLIRSLRTACFLVVAGLLMVGCSSPIPSPASASPTPALGDGLRQELGTLQSCLEGATSSLSADNAICYQGFSYTLDGYTWPTSDTQEEAALRTAGIALSECLGGTMPTTCGVDLTAFNTDRDQLLGLVP